MNTEAMYKLTYGLFVLTARKGDKDNGCIINTAIQAASMPNQISICLNKADYEEAEHAAKFAELLGEDLEPNMKATTKNNLAWRVDCEFGATQGKYDLALCSKKNDLDAIHEA